MQKIILSDPKTGKSYSIELDAGKTKIDGTRVGKTIDAASMGLPGYEIQITGGSDRDGFPIRADVPGRGRKKVLLSGGPCYKKKSKGIKKRKTVRGNTITQDIVQINAKIIKKGAKPIDKLLGVGEGVKEEKVEKEEKPAEKEKPTKEEKKPSKKKEPAKEEKKAKGKPKKEEEAD
ncbi:MAG: 30S ribosomal protein S6e [Candidatus Hydrothermarchaeaceae archaeon]